MASKNGTFKKKSSEKFRQQVYVIGDNKLSERDNGSMILGRIVL